MERPLVKSVNALLFIFLKRESSEAQILCYVFAPFSKIVLAIVRRTVFGTEFSSHPSGNRDIIFGVTVATRKTFIFTATLRIVNDHII